MNVMKRILTVIAVLCSAATFGENLYYSPALTSTSTNTFGSFIYSAENWKTADGANKAPADGDVLICNKVYWKQMTAQDKNGKYGACVSGLICDTAVSGCSQGELQIQSGGVGLVLTNSTSTLSWYNTARFHGTGDVPLYVHNGATWGMQRVFQQSDGGRTRLIKRGAGTVNFSDGSAYGGPDRGTWAETRLEAGTFTFYYIGSKGPNKINYPQLFPTNHVLTFADQGSGAKFNIGYLNLDLDNVTIREDSPLAKPDHILTSSASVTSNVYIRINGTPGLNPMGFGGKVTERAGLLWNPTSSENTFVFSNSVSTTKGGILVKNGTVRLENGASFTQLSTIELSAGTKFQVAHGAGDSFKATTLILADNTAEVTLGEGVYLLMEKITVNGEDLPDGIYTAANAKWINGNGAILVNPTIQDAWWTNDAEHPKALAENVVTNWYGLDLTGDGFSLTAGSGSLVLLGEGGIKAQAAGQTYTIGWPLVLCGSQTWQASEDSNGNGDQIRLTGPVSFMDNKKWVIQNSDNGRVCFVGEKSFSKDLTVSNGYVYAIGDESLGTSGGTTEFEVFAKKEHKGKLVIEPEPGKNEVSFHRNLTFHYRICAEWGDFMELPADCTVNFYGAMKTSCANLISGDPWPCHWNYSCPHTTTVNWYGGMYAALNHKFPDGTHNIHKALTGGDRFIVGQNATVNLLVTGNTIGAATGGMNGRLNCRAPYALDGRSKNQLLSLNGTLDLGGYDQALSILHATSGSGKVTSAKPALLHIMGSQVVDSSYEKSCTNATIWTEAAGLSVERTLTTTPMALIATSTSTGTVQVAAANARLVFVAGKGVWPNASEAIVKAGKMELEHNALGRGTAVKFVKTNNAYGKMKLFAKVRQRVASLEVDGVRQTDGTWGSSESNATNKNDDLFEGPGILKVGDCGMRVIVR